MSTYILSLLCIGLLLLFVALGSGFIARLPLSFAIIYLLVGVLLGSEGIGLINLQIETGIMKRLTEFVVIVSVFGCGLKMNRPLNPWAWNTTVRLIGLLMPLSIFAIAIFSHWIFGFDWGEAILLGAILSPTDPVLASEVQLANIRDRDEVRFGLTSEGGLNDSLAFPFVYLGIFLFKDNNWQNWFRQWVLIDLLWAISSAIVMGIVVARVINWLDEQVQDIHPAERLMEDFVAISTVLLTYSLTELVNGYGFLAVFVAGVEMQRLCRLCNKRLSQLEFTEQVEKLLEVGIILLLGALLNVELLSQFARDSLVIAGLLLFFIRPLGVWLSTIGSNLPSRSRFLLGWFGIRGVGSLYYLAYAFSQDVKGDLSQRLVWITYTTVLVSMILHGITATPLMNWYKRNLKAEVGKPSS